MWCLSSTELSCEWHLSEDSKLDVRTEKGKETEAWSQIELLVENKEMC